MNKVLYKVWLEWDLGQEYLVFATKALAKEFVNQVIKFYDCFANYFPNGFADVEKAGFCSILTVTLVQ